MLRVMWAWGYSVYGDRGVSESKDIVFRGRVARSLSVMCMEVVV